MNSFDAKITAHITRQTGRDHAAIDLDAARVGEIVDRWYVEVAKLSPNVPDLLNRIDNLGKQYSRELFRKLIDQMEQRGIDSYTTKADIIRRELPERAKMWLLGKARETLVNAPPVPGQPMSRLPAIKLAMPVVDLANLSSLSAQAKDQLLKQVLFKPMTRAQVRAILVQQQVVGQIAPITKLLQPHQLISVISRAQSQGLTRAQIIRQELEPLFHSSKATVTRVARDTGTMITNQANLQAFQGLGALLLGYRCNCVTDKASRPWHQERKGVIFWLNPKEGQKGLQQCPSPPYEPPDPNERPAGTPQLAFNCRCYLTPVTRSMLALDN